MPYGHLITATVMTLGVCQGRSAIASFSILTSASRGPSAIAELLVVNTRIGHLQSFYTLTFRNEMQYRHVHNGVKISDNAVIS